MNIFVTLIFNTFLTDNINIYTIQFLHAILRPPSKVLNGKYVKSTIKDSQRAFTLKIQENQNIGNILEEMRNSYLEENKPLQPFIIVRGQEFAYKQFFVAVDDKYYEFTSYLEAIQFCFKFIFVLDMQYTKECTAVWTFLQIFFFHIEDFNKLPAVETFIKDINCKMKSI